MVPIDYKKAYFKLYSAMADAIDCIDAGDPQGAKALLVAAHQRTEKMVMEQPDGVGVAFKLKKPKDPER